MKKNTEIERIIDHTNIRPEATAEKIKKTCKEAKKYGFRGVCVNPKWVKLVKRELKDIDIHPVKSAKGGAAKPQFNRVKVVVLVDPPMGISPHKKRMKICKRAKKDGTDELDVVMNIVDLKYRKYKRVLKDLKEISKILPTKVIIGSGFLTDAEIEKASQIVKKSGAFCVKTATERDPLDRFELKEKAKHLKIMRKSAPGLKIKASGSIKTLKDFKMMLKAGADIIGTSSGVRIMNEFKK